MALDQYFKPFETIPDPKGQSSAFLNLPAIKDTNEVTSAATHAMTEQQLADTHDLSEIFTIGKSPLYSMHYFILCHNSLPYSHSPCTTLLIVY